MILDDRDIINNLDSDDTKRPLSAKMGKVLANMTGEKEKQKSTYRVMIESVNGTVFTGEEYTAELKAYVYRNDVLLSSSAVASYGRVEWHYVGDTSSFASGLTANFTSKKAVSNIYAEFRKSKTELLGVSNVLSLSLSPEIVIPEIPEPTPPPEIPEIPEVDFLDIYPVGAIYITTSSRSPAAFLGGRWELIDSGRVLLSAGGTYPLNSTGGRETHTLTVSQLPRHQHGVEIVNSGGESAGYGLTQTAGFRDRVMIQGNSAKYINTAAVGGSSPFSLMQPYLAVYMWKRTG